MTLSEAIEIVIGRTKHERYRWLCSEDNPDVVQRERYRFLVMQQASNGHHDYPALRDQLGNAVSAMERVASAFTHGDQVMVDPAEQVRRLSICYRCEFFDGGRCRLCGCFANLKTRLATEHCPHDPPKW